METRFTIIYKWTNGKWLVQHLHQSIPDLEQMDGEEFPVTLGKQVKKNSNLCNKNCLNGVRILLVEDNEINTEIARELLTEEGCIVDPMHYYRCGAVALIFNATAPFCLQSSHLYYIGVTSKNILKCLFNGCFHCFFLFTACESYDNFPSILIVTTCKGMNFPLF